MELLTLSTRDWPRPEADALHACRGVCRVADLFSHVMSYFSLRIVVAAVRHGAGAGQVQKSVAETWIVSWQQFAKTCTASTSSGVLWLDMVAVEIACRAK